MIKPQMIKSLHVTNWHYLKNLCRNVVFITKAYLTMYQLVLKQVILKNTPN